MTAAVGSPAAMRIRGARQHNLKGIDLDLPHDRLVAISGPSGSGKSSLAFDTIYAEGQRRYVEGLSSYARQFLERMERPDVDSIEGLRPAVAIGRASPTTTVRSTVGTVTEIADHLRVLFARFGEVSCAGCGAPVRPLDPSAAAEALAAVGGRATVAAPLAAADPARLAADGYAQALLADGAVVSLDGLGTWPPGAAVVVDRVAADGDPPAVRRRLAEAVGTAYALGDGRAVIATDDGGRRTVTDRFACAACGRPAAAPTPSLLSFNSPAGACPTCRGFGDLLDYDIDRCVPEPDRALEEGAVEPFVRSAHRHMHRKMLEWARARGVPVDVAWRDLPEAVRKKIIEGERGRGGFIGLLPFLRRLERKIYRPHIRFFLRRYRSARRCPDCGGARLRPEALAVRIDGRSIADVSSLTVGEARAWIEGIRLPGPAAAILLGEVRARLETLAALGLEYLTLDRLTRTLSGGEAERIHLAAALAARLVETIYVLDEPTVGLHPRDTDRLLAALRRLVDLGNTVVVVEHDPDLLRRADLLVDLGPAGGPAGGEVVAAGPPEAVARTKSPTARYIGGATVRFDRRSVGGRGGEITLRGCRANNLKGIDASFPLGAITAVTGVSGSGKSSLVVETLVPAVEAALGGAPERIGAHDRLEGAVLLAAVEAVDQSPIQRSSRSNPATYVGAFDGIRRAFASTPEARRRGWGPGRFSFNVPGGRCEACRGEGTVRVEMIFLADLLVTCDACGGRRFTPETLEIRYKGLTISEALDLTVDEARDFFRASRETVAPLRLLGELGLGYLRLGQPLTTLSGGEAQRLKLAASLLEPPAPRPTRLGGHPGGPARVLYVLDEPTTGLHPAEVEVLVKALRRLADAGHGVVVVEHHLGVVAAADHVIDLGPEAGAEGGRVVYAGPPAGLAGAPTHTGRHLREYLGLG